MGHYDDAYEEDDRKAREEKREKLTQICYDLMNISSKLLRSYYNENSTVYQRVQEALFWLEHDIP